MNISLVPKPAGTTWTDEQWNAISLKGDDMLVAAAAGSGKTAVLVERIIRRVCDEQDPIDVDQLLVATFTNAAAAEMRDRIREALEKEWFRKPESDHLRRQLALIHRASITTLHSFCLDVIRRYFQAIELDPAFRIANEIETELMRHDVLQELFEHYYGSSPEDSEFWTLVDWFGGERGDDGLFMLVQKLYDYSRSHPAPEEWLTRTAESFNVSAEGNDISDVWFDSLLHDIKPELSGLVELLRGALQWAEHPQGPSPYIANLQEDVSFTQHLVDAAGSGAWRLLYEAFQEPAFGKLKPCKGDEVDKGLQDQVKSMREQAKKQFNQLKDQLFQRSPEQFAWELNRMAPVMQALVRLVRDFAARYEQARRSKGLLDFADLEHYCLRILRGPGSSEDGLVPSQAALDYRDQFAEVLLDEYQDTNSVQEAIVALISRAAPGNRFMVGDVKQSIYRFRLAEPALFLDKYKTYRNARPAEVGEACGEGLRIDLARNFRSRREIVNGVNFIFKQLMNDRVAEIAYDTDAELICGASYPSVTENEVMNLAVDMLFIDRSESVHDEEEQNGGAVDHDVDASEDGADEAADGILEDAAEMETARLEARTIALHIRRLMDTQDRPFLVYDKKIGGSRPVTYRDMVILLRATQQWAPVMMEEFRLAGIPTYAELSVGYFTATEVEVSLSLLKVIDNPYQDIPLAAVLRSPMFQFTAEHLALIRIHRKGRSYFDALATYADAENVSDESLQANVRQFLERLGQWRTEARHGATADLLWRIYRETGYYDLVGGLPGGVQRQANLRALYDRARQYEATSFRGLFRFLRFIERMRDNGGDLGTAGAVGEQEDVVRIMSIHKSKGLEFPVVFVAGLAKTFNMRELNDVFLLHKQLGFGPRFVDTELRVSYPTLPGLAIRHRLRMEALAEEMRILYVALTRAKEKLILVGTVKNLQKQLSRWGSFVDCPDWNLPDYALAKARSYLDWIGPALIRHPQAAGLRNMAGVRESTPEIMLSETSRWNLALIGQAGLAQAAAAKEIIERRETEALSRTSPVIGYFDRQAELTERFAWKYRYQMAQGFFSKTSVSEMKRLSDRSAMLSSIDEPWEVPVQEHSLLENRNTPPGDALQSDGQGALNGFLLRRPRFKEQRKLTAVEKGTAYHAVMQHVPLIAGLSRETVERTADNMVERQLLTPEQKNSVDSSVIASFFMGDLGQRVLGAEYVRREVPFSYGLAAGEVYPEADESTKQETVLVQGVIDCLFQESDGLVLLDFKTDAVKGQVERAAERYRLQLELYAKAIEHIWGQPVKEKYLFFFDGAHTVKM
jgi:ATP-dependent helicase/nuclease subunit A